jgi:hypothetical protein
VTAHSYRRSNAVPGNNDKSIVETAKLPRVPKKQATAQQAEAVVDALMKAFDQPLSDWERPRAW